MMISGLFTLSLASLALALPPILQSCNSLGALQPRQSCAETCGTVCYYQSTVDEAVSTGCNYYKEAEQVDSYPHTYNNYEGFDFPVSGPYQEFPIVSTNHYEPYSGGSPGPDRVIFNSNCDYAGTITHTGASGDDFVDCQG